MVWKFCGKAQFSHSFGRKNVLSDFASLKTIYFFDICRSDFKISRLISRLIYTAAGLKRSNSSSSSIGKIWTLTIILLRENTFELDLGILAQFCYFSTVLFQKLKSRIIVNSSQNTWKITIFNFIFRWVFFILSEKRLPNYP